MSEKRYPVIEVFGPTIQGEGAEAGLPCHFIRFGGCDFRCTWCDSMYAVDPAEVRTHAEKLTTDEILDRIMELEGDPGWVVLSGGNPALHDLHDLNDALHGAGFKTAVETQGTVWKPWLARVDRLTVSPKPPSSGMVNPINARAFHDFYSSMAVACVAAAAGADAGAATAAVCKIVIATQEDLDWAKRLIEHHPFPELHLSACTPQEGDWEVEYPMDRDGNLIMAVVDRYTWLCDQVAGDPALARARVLPQLHVLAWGAQRGH